jgi:hypothetical protein
MLRLIYFLLIMYVVYRLLKYFFRLILKSQNSQRLKKERREIIDIDYEEIKEDEKSSK